MFSPMRRYIRCIRRNAFSHRVRSLQIRYRRRANEIGRINFISRSLDFIGHGGSVAIAHRICAPTFQKFQCLVYEPRFGGNRETSSKSFLFHISVSDKSGKTLPLCKYSFIKIALSKVLSLYAPDRDSLRQLSLYERIYDEYRDNDNHKPRIHSSEVVGDFRFPHDSEQPDGKRRFLPYPRKYSPKYTRSNRTGN